MGDNRIHPGDDDSGSESDSDWSDASSITVTSSAPRRGSQTSVTSHTRTFSRTWLKHALVSNDLVTNRDKWSFLTKVIVVTMVPIIALVTASAMNIARSASHAASVKRTQTQLDNQAGYQSLVSHLQAERALVISRFHDYTFRGELDFIHAYIQTDESLSNVTGSETWTPFWIDHTRIESPGLFKYYLWLTRISPSGKSQNHPDRIVKFYSSSIFHFMSEMTRKSLNVKSSKIGRLSSVTIVITRAKESLGNIHALACSFFYEGTIEKKKRETVYRLNWFGASIIQGARHQSPSFDHLYQTLYLDHASDLAHHVDELVTSVLEEEQRSNTGSQALVDWYGNITSYVTILSTIRRAVEDETRRQLDDDVTSAYGGLIAIGVIVALTFLLMLVISFAAYRMISKLRMFTAGIVTNTKSIREEKRMAEDILLKMLPPSVAKQLKLRKPVNPEVYDSVSIFFSDVVGFTSISAKSTPMQVVAFLNQLYDFFDNVIDKYDVYKVETIGDAYMVASGLPVRNGERHANEIASMALDLRDGIELMQIPHMVLHKLQLRIGMHTGPCVAGVVGNKMPRYCLFGQTVQIASKMESTGVAQKIQVTKTMHLKLEKLGGHTYVTQARDTIEIEGVGEVDRYWLVGRRTSFIKAQSREEISISHVIPTDSNSHHSNPTSQQSDSNSHHSNPTSQQPDGNSHHSNPTSQQPDSNSHHSNTTSQQLESKSHHSNKDRFQVLERRVHDASIKILDDQNHRVVRNAGSDLTPAPVAPLT